MTTEGTTTTTQPGPPPYPPITSLRRSRTDRKIGGVAGGLGRYAGIDPLIIRILFVVLTIFGGSGLLLYALGWLLIPADGENESEGQRLLAGRSTRKVTAIIAVLVVVIGSMLVFGAALDTGPGLGGLAVLVVIGAAAYALLRNGRRSGPAQPQQYGPVPPPASAATTVGEYGQTAGTAYTAAASEQPPPYWATPVQPPPPPAPRERSPLGRITVSVALIVVGLMVGWNWIARPADDFRPVAVVGTALAVVATGLLVGAFAGRARGLIVLGIVLTLATAGTAQADRRLDGGVGDRTWRPTTASAAEREHRLGIGDARLDLTALPPGSKVDVTARVGVGALVIYVPSDARVVAEGHVGAGSLKLLDRPSKDGTDLNGSTTEGPAADPGVTAITIDAEVGLGQLEVRR